MSDNEKNITIDVDDLQETFEDFIDVFDHSKFEAFLRTLRIRTRSRNARRDNHARQVREFHQRESMKPD
jgi:hypothetical protein